MHIKHFNKPKKNHAAIKSPEYRCYVNKGIDVTLHHHSTSLPIHTADHNAWEFAVPYIRNAELIRQHVMVMKEQVVQRDHSQDIERDVERIKKSIANLYRLAEAADPTDEDGIPALQDRLMALERDKKEKEKLLGSVTTTEEKQEKLLASLDRFEKWAATIRPFLDDLSYTISNEDKISALVILGVKVRVFPVSDSYPDRVVMSLLPPDIARFCDYDLTRP